MLTAALEVAQGHAADTHRAQRWVSATPPFGTDREGAAVWALRALMDLYGAYDLWRRVDLHPAGMEVMARQALEFAVRAVIAQRVGIAHQRLAPGYDPRDAAAYAVDVEREFMVAVLAPIAEWALGNSQEPA